MLIPVVLCSSLTAYSPAQQPLEEVVVNEVVVKEVVVNLAVVVNLVVVVKLVVVVVVVVVVVEKSNLQQPLKKVARSLMFLRLQSIMKYTKNKSFVEIKM